MAVRFFAWVRERPLTAFYLLAFAITWLGWLPQAAYSHDLFPFDSILFYVLGGVGPLAATYLVLLGLHGPDFALSRLFAPLLRWRVGAGWYVVALFGGLALWLTASAAGGALSLAAERLGPFTAMIPGYLWYLVAAIPEELAWRAFALPRFQQRYSALVASLLMGALWALWHLPLLLVKDSVMASYPLGAYIAYLLAMAVIYAFLYNSTGSALILVIFHAGVNTFGNFLGLPQTLVAAAVAALLVAISGPARLAYGARKEAESKEAAQAV